MPGVPVQALTATATKRVREDVKRLLKLHDAVEVTGSVDRPNISLAVVDGGTMDEEEERADRSCTKGVGSVHGAMQGGTHDSAIYNAPPNFTTQRITQRTAHCTMQCATHCATGAHRPA